MMFSLNWKFEKEMSFLLPYLENRDTFTNYKNLCDPDPFTEQTAEESDNEFSERPDDAANETIELDVETVKPVVTVEPSATSSTVSNKEELVGPCILNNTRSR